MGGMTMALTQEALDAITENTLSNAGFQQGVADAMKLTPDGATEAGSVLDLHGKTYNAVRTR
jgi:hypothetical protein